VDDILVLGRVLSADDVKSLATKGAEAFFKVGK
jgi:methylmalonyl-CoA mutase cobalamin-binding subunit